MTQAPLQDLPSAAPESAVTGDTTGTYAIVEASGQQFWLQTDRYVDLDRISADVDSTVTLENVLLVKDASVPPWVSPMWKGPLWSSR